MWLLLAVGAAVLWGLNYVLAEQVLRRISLFTLMAVELGIACVVALALSLLRDHFGTDIAVLARDGRALGLLIASTIVFTTANLLILFSIVERNATLAGLIEISYPIFIALFAWLLFRESHLNPGVVLGAVFIFAGVAIVYLYS